MIALVGGSLVLPGRVVPGGSLLLEHGRVAAIEHGRVDPAGATIIETHGAYILPGFVDVHVHGLGGYDTLDGGDAIARIAALLPAHGVTAFCPTTAACTPAELDAACAAVHPLRTERPTGAARVLPAHLESNFINPAYRGAQPAACLRLPPHTGAPAEPDGAFSALDILDVVARWRAEVGIVTLAPELPGGIDLLRSLHALGHRVALGHSGATFEQALEAADAGARHVTHLFNAMSPMHHRRPGLAGAALAHEGLCVELVCDAVHVHPAVCRMALTLKGAGGIMAVTDATSVTGLVPGSTGRLGGQVLHAAADAARLADGTLAGSTLTMERAFQQIVKGFGGSVTEASAMCSGTPARELGLSGMGALVDGALADVVVMDREFRIVRTFIDGLEAYSASGHQAGA